MSAQAPEAAAGSPPPARVTIRLSNNWDGSLSYDVLREDVDKPSGQIFVGRKELLGPLVNAIGQPDRRGTYLISGYRGAGKTSLVIEAARQAREKLLREGEWHLVPIVLNVSEVSASLSSGTEQRLGRLQIDARRLLTALLRQLRNEFVVKPAALRVQRARRSWREAVRSWFRRVVLRKREPTPEPDPMEVLAGKIDRAFGKADATEYVERTQQRRDDRLVEAYESRLQLNLPNLLKLLAALAAVIAAGIGLGFVADPIVAAAVALGGAALISFQWSRSVSGSTEQQESINVELARDNSVHQLENDLREIFTKLYEQKRRTIVVLEELDKVDDSQGKQLDAVIRYFKNLFTQAPALFFFLTDKQYYDLIEAKIDQARRNRTYSIEHTFFTHRVFVNRPSMSDCLEYLSKVVERKSEKDAMLQIGAVATDRVRDLGSMDLRERLVRVLLFRAQDHFFDLKNEIRRYLNVSNGRSVLECDDETLPPNEQAYAAFQFLVEQKARSFGFRGGREYANEVLRNCLFSVFNDSSPGEWRKLDSYHPLRGPGGDQLGATEQAQILRALEALVDDLARGGAVQRDSENGQFAWQVNAAHLFSPVAKPEQHEEDLVTALERNAALLAVLGDDGVLRGVVPDSARVRDLIQRLEADVKRVRSLGTPLPREEALAMTSSAGAEVAKLLTDAFDAHRLRLAARLGRSLEPIESGTAGSAWRLGTTVPTPDPGAGAVFLVYGSSDRVRAAVASHVADPSAMKRFGVVHVAVEEPESFWPTEADALKREWEQVFGDAANRVTCSVVPFHEWRSAADVQERWSELTADELILHELRVDAVWQRLGAVAQPAMVARGGPYVLRRAGPDASPQSFDSFENAIREWLAGGDEVLCWTVVGPILASVVSAFAGAIESRGEPCAYLPATITDPARALSLWRPQPGGSPPPEVASVGRLIDQGRVVLGLDRSVDAQLPPQHSIPPHARVCLHWDENPLLSVLAPATGISTLLVSEDPTEAHRLSALVARFDPAQAQALVKSAAERGLALAMSQLAWDLRESNPDESRKWREELVVTDNAWVIQPLADAFRADDPKAARALDERLVELDWPPAIQRLALELVGEDPGRARSLQDRFVGVGEAEQIGELARAVLKDHPDELNRWSDLGAAAENAEVKKAISAAVSETADVKAPAQARRRRQTPPKK